MSHNLPIYDSKDRGGCHVSNGNARVFVELMTPNKPHPETDSKVGLVGPGRKPAKCPLY